MKRVITIILLTVCFGAKAQVHCGTSEYLKQKIASDPGLEAELSRIEHFTSQKLASLPQTRLGGLSGVIRIPVVFHVLYNNVAENITEERIHEQLAIINRDFRRLNADTSNTPERFRNRAADMQFEFVLAKSDPQRSSTNGIERRYTAVTSWMTDDKMKFQSEYGLDGWDSRYYLNVWVCNLTDALGYATFPGGDPKLDGIVLDYRIVGKTGRYAQYNEGRTAVHEFGHWLNLRHIWGDEFCGDDHVQDTPRQMSFTPGCPTGVRTTCNNGTNGDMYMNYMDFTADACVNLFTQGQKDRARVLFNDGGARNSILASYALDEPIVQSSPVEDFYPRWMEAKIYPNPAQNSVNIYFEHDERWIGKTIVVFDAQGRLVARKTIDQKNYVLDISAYKPGVYFVKTQKERDLVVGKFIKL